MMDDSLDLSRPSQCVIRNGGGEKMECWLCENHCPKGCEAREQDGEIFFWSDSYCAYISMGRGRPKPTPQIVEELTKRKIVL